MKALAQLSEKALLLCGGNLWMTGFALGIDSKNSLSVNFYY